MSNFTIRPISTEDRPWVKAFMVEQWGAAPQAVRGELFYPHELPGFIAENADRGIGVATYRRLDATTCELATLNSLQSGLGVGEALVQAVAEAAKAMGSTKLVVVTTNDNLHALRFYQRRGFVLSEVRIGAVNSARSTIKPEIPVLGSEGISIRDEIELVLNLTSEEIR
jgi:GNAT superfamily N-acetyltransferase